MPKLTYKALFTGLAAAVILSACTAQTTSSRYGGSYGYSETQTSSAYGGGCSEVVQSCGGYYVIPTYHQYLLQQPEPLQPAPPVIEAPVIEAPVVLPPLPEPPVIYEPLPEPPVYTPPPSPICPEGSIPGYGGRDCIPITIPRK